MNYVIAVLADRIQAETAYTALETAGVPPEQCSIVGKGYKSADEIGFIDPAVQARKQAKFMAFWLVPFGFIGGFAFNLSTQFQLFPWAGPMGNHIIGGIFGAIAGAIGSAFVGGGIGVMSGSDDALPYRNRINDGKYLIVVSGPPNVTNKATRILRQFNPENIQGYLDNQRA